MPQLFYRSLKCLSLCFCTALFVQSYSSCTKSSPVFIGEDTTTTNPPKDTTTTPPKDTTTTPPKDTGTVKGRVFLVGTGSGSLTIDGNNFVVGGTQYTLQNADVVKIKSGAYQEITIKNIVIANGNLVTIQNDGLVRSGGLSLSELNNVSVSGNGTPGTDRGFIFKDIAGTPIKLTGWLSNFSLKYFYFENITGEVISYANSGMVYNGTPRSYASNLSFSHIDCVNTGTLFSSAGGDTNGSRITGLLRNLEISYVNFSNAPSVRSVVYVSNADEYNFHHNVVNNINTAVNEHNGVFFVRGNGKFHHNMVTNHQGNVLRNWVYSHGAVPKTVEIYDNIVYNSRKYSAIEVQSFDQYISANSTYVNVKAYNNTIGSLNTSRDWYGVLIDVYTLFQGKCEVFNNLAFNIQTPNGNNRFVNQQAAATIIERNNLYYASYTDAGLKDVLQFKLNDNAPVKGKGEKVGNLVDDYYGVSRNTDNPSVGAVE